MKRVKQVTYSNAKSKENFLDDMRSIAMFIGSALNHPVSECNGSSVVGNVSTIHVEQYKEKFGEVRIYCVLAFEPLVRDAFPQLL